MGKRRRCGLVSFSGDLVLFRAFAVDFEADDLLATGVAYQRGFEGRVISGTRRRVIGVCCVLIA